MTADTQLLPEEPLDVLGTQLAEDGAASDFLFIGASGLWRMRLRDGGWDEPALVAREPGYDGRVNFPPVWNGHYLAYRNEDESLRVVPLDGRAPFIIDDLNGGFCFLPGGERLLVIDDDDARIHDLKEPASAIRRQNAFHKFEFPYFDDIDQPDSVMFVKDGAGRNYFTAGCYGYFACWPVRLDADGVPEPAGPPVTLVSPFSYDPTDIYAAGPDSAVWIGSGGGLLRFEANTGKHTEVSIGRNSDLGSFRGIVPSTSGDAWVRTKDKAAIWRANGDWLPLPDEAISAVAFRENALWCMALGGEILTKLDVSGLSPRQNNPGERA
jgi:hypothetical protein